MATLSEIASSCGVSVATVSYVLNGKGDEKRISPAMQEKIISRAAELGYTKIIPSNPSKLKIALYWPQRNIESTILSVIMGINAAFPPDPSFMSLNICPFESNHLSDLDSLWSGKDFDAAMIVSANSTDLAALSRNPVKKPVVLSGRSLPGYPCVTVDHYEAGKMAALHAICKGGEDIGLVINPASFKGMNMRSDGFLQTCREYGIDASRNVFYCENTVDAGYELGTAMIREKRLPRVITCIYDIVAYGMLRAFVEAGLPVGDGYQILATGSSMPSFFARCSPPMTVIDLRIQELAERGLRLAMDIALKRASSKTEIVLSPNMIYRASSPVPTFEERERLEALLGRRGL